MKVNQIANLLNQTINPEIIGESAPVAEDLSNIIDIGRKLESTGTFSDNFDNFTKSLIDKIGCTVFVDREYSGTAPNILRNGWEYGSALEKVRCDLPTITESNPWTLADLENGTTTNPFIIEKPTIQAKYFNSKTAFKVAITLGREQVREAFLSAENMNRFFSMIENRIKMIITMDTDALIMRTINNLIANKIHANHNVINLLTDYNTLTSSTLTASNCLQNADFLRYVAKTIMLYKGYLQTASMLYNNDGYVTFTKPEDLQFVILSEVAKDLEVNLYANTYNDEFVRLTGYSEIPYWQASGTTNSFTDHSTINITALDADKQSFTVNQTGVIATMFDINAAMVCNERRPVSSIYEPMTDYYNYFYFVDAMYMNDLAENCIVFIIHDAEA